MANSPTHNKILRPLLRGLPLIVGATLLCVMIAAWYLHHTVPQYESTARIRLADIHTGEASSNLYRDFDVFANANQIGTEVEMVKARVLVEKTLDSIGMETTVYRKGTLMKKELYLDNPLRITAAIHNPDWYGRPIGITVLSDTGFLLMAPDSAHPVRGHFGVPIRLADADFLVSRNEALLAAKPETQLTDKYLVIVNTRSMTVDKIIDNLDITSIDKDIPILRIIYKSAIPQKAADYVNILANAYVSDYIEAKYRAADITVSFLDRQLAEVGRRLAHSEDTIEHFRTGENIINFTQETETNLRKIAQMKIQLANQRMSLAAIDSLYDYMQKGKTNFLDLAPNFEAFTDLLSTELVKKIKQLQADRKDLLLVYTEKEEKVKVLDEKINDLSAYLMESIANTRRDYTIKYREIAGQITAAESAFNGLPTREKRMGMLDRDFALNEKIYLYLHQKRTEAGIARAATISFHRIVARGEVPREPVSPKKVIILAVAAILGLLGSTSLIYAVHKAKAKVNDAATIEKNSSTPLAVEVRVHRKPESIQSHFNDILLALELKGILRYPAVITCSSFTSGEGKQFFITHLSAALQQLNRRVLSTDATELIPGTVAERAALEPIFQHWRQNFDLVLIRNQPVTQSNNALAFMALADTNLFFLDARLTPAARIGDADALKEEFPIPHMEFVLNRAHYNPRLRQRLVKLFSR